MALNKHISIVPEVLYQIGGGILREARQRAIAKETWVISILSSIGRHVFKKYQADGIGIDCMD